MNSNTVQNPERNMISKGNHRCPQNGSERIKNLLLMLHYHNIKQRAWARDARACLVVDSQSKK